MTRPIFISLVAAAASLCLPAAAEVTARSDTGFVSQHAASVEADPATIWTALTHPATWWNGAHSWSGDAANFSLEATPGGCFCETWEAGAVRHMEVASLVTNTRLVLTGGLGPLQAEAVTGAMVWTLTPGEDGRTESTVTYKVGGYIDGGADAWAAPVDGVIGEQHARLVRLIETGAPE